MSFYLLHLSSFKGMRDDPTCILDEDLSSLCLCALHCEMRNTEQILKSVHGLLAYEIGSLPECNEELAKYGPDNFNGDRITVKLLDLDSKQLLGETIFHLPLVQVSVHIKIIYMSRLFFFLDCHFCKSR